VSGPQAITLLVSGLIGMKLAGPGTIYLKQTLDFLLVPVKINDVITVCVELLSFLNKIVFGITLAVKTKRTLWFWKGMPSLFCT
jgi:hypothetical protein